MTTKGRQGNILDEYPNYEITKEGKIYSRNRNTFMKPFENILKHRPNCQYYLRIALINKNGERKKIMVHRLVALAYIPNPYNQSFVNHRDGNKHNNRMENLEWISNRENCIHAAKNGLIKGKLTNKQVKEIRSDKFDNWTHSEIGKHFHVSRSMISQIKRGERKQYV